MYDQSPVWKSVMEIQERYKKVYKVNDPKTVQVLGNFSYFPEKCESLFELVKTESPDLILEIGFNCGHTSAIMISGSPESEIVSFDLGDRSYMDEASAVISSFHEKFTYVKGDSKATVTPYLVGRFGPSPIPVLPFCLVDGDHSYGGVLADLASVSPWISLGGIIVIDDVDIPEILFAVEDSNLTNFTELGTLTAERYTKNNCFSSMKILRRTS